MNNLFDTISDMYGNAAVVAELIKWPYAAEIKAGKLDLSVMTEAELLVAMKTAVYLGYPTDDILDEFLWIIGRDRDSFNRYFTINYNTCCISPSVHDKILISLFEDLWMRKCPSSQEYDVKCSRMIKLFPREVLSVRFCDYDYCRVAKYNFSLFKHLFDMDGIVVTAAAFDLKCLKYVCRFGTKIPREMIQCCIKAGNLETLRYVIGLGHDPSNDDLNHAAKHGHSDILEYLLTECKLTPSYPTLDYAVSGGNIKCVKQLDLKLASYSCDKEALIYKAIPEDRYIVVGYLAEKFGIKPRLCLPRAYTYDAKNCMSYFIKNGFPLTQETQDRIVRLGHPRRIKVLHQAGYPINENTLIAAIRSRVYANVVAALDLVPEWGEKAYVIAAIQNMGQMVELLHAYAKVHCPHNVVTPALIEKCEFVLKTFPVSNTSAMEVMRNLL